MNKNVFYLMLIVLLTYTTPASASPKTIILLRHADKLAQAEPGPTLSAKGFARSLKFTEYFLKHFGEPDYIIAGKPKGKNASIRELQTIAPLVNILSKKYPEKGFNILHPYEHNEHEKLADYLLNDSKFDDKLILICWRHTKIVELAKALNVEKKLPPWPDDDYDSVYVISYDAKGKVDRFIHLKHQYPISADITWEKLWQMV